jgi:hypothetical protein
MNDHAKERASGSKSILIRPFVSAGTMSGFLESDFAPKYPRIAVVVPIFDCTSRRCSNGRIERVVVRVNHHKGSN